MNQQNSLRVEPVHSADLRREVYRLRYRAYVAEGEITPNASKMLVDEYDVMPNHVLWALFEGDRLAGTIRSTFYEPGSQDRLPEHGVFASEIESVVPANARIVSGNRFAIDPEMDRSQRRYTYALFKHHMLLGLVKADWALAAVRSNHIPFYQRVLLLDQVSEPRRYPNMNSGFFLMATTFLDSYPVICARHPTLRATSKDLELIDHIQDLFEAPAAPAVSAVTTATTATGRAAAASVLAKARTAA